MNLLQNIKKILLSFSLALIVLGTTACGGGVQATQPPTLPAPTNYSVAYSQLERGNSPAGQNFGDWVVKSSKGLLQDAYVRDNDKLGVVISPQIQPTEVRNLAKALTEGFRRNFPNHDLTVLVYAPDKHLILTAKYNSATQRVQYQ